MVGELNGDYGTTLVVKSRTASSVMVAKAIVCVKIDFEKVFLTTKIFASKIIGDEISQWLHLYGMGVE